MRALLIAAVVLVTSGLGGGARAEPVLKPQVTIERDMVRLGDLFAELPAAIDPAIEVARAPAPGQKTTFDASALLNIANSQRIGWRPKRPLRPRGRRARRPGDRPGRAARSRRARPDPARHAGQRRRRARQ
ncbi:MAG: hypothetical protein WDO24_01975 [Pseudomonadota bacterium]